MEPKLAVEICVGTSCCLMGGTQIVECLENMAESLKSRLDISYVSCYNQCTQGPRVRVGAVMLYRTTPDMVLKAIAEQLEKPERGKE
ncbi:thioredoxin-like protein [Hydrogenispora ethanolica]|jgi:NADH:ubiquinone oxidoreductase subunit E|uniref:Thioredoxin-like protein n=1 Tax=Hydrogenispora ethanolica TaxID=1082276 RepID=A0A4R1RD80_HYDET|nr:NAD(P)H-dependent oxidoreductase subunit E [Hydrogenispora ethanolica]TCL63798.1 thioredoxin-like protein [Hydrogenispora ethanolica]